LEETIADRAISTSIYSATVAGNGVQLVKASERQINALQLMQNRVGEYHNTEQRFQTPPLRSDDRSRVVVENVGHRNNQANPIMSRSSEGRYMTSTYRNKPLNEQRMCRNYDHDQRLSHGANLQFDESSRSREQVTIPSYRNGSILDCCQ